MTQKINAIMILVFTFYVKHASAINDPGPGISFKENKGQMSDQFYNPRLDILFSGTSGNLAYYLKNNGISYQLSRVDSWAKISEEEKQSFPARRNNTKEQPEKITTYRLDINWLNANTNASIKKGEALDGYDNYYLTSCPQGALNVKSYKNITYQNLYSGIDLKWYEKNGNLKYDYIVAAGTDYKQIQLEFNGAQKLSVNKKGELIIKTPLGILTEAAPYVTQNGKQLAAKWLIKNNIILFDIKNIDPSLPFIIDPLIRLWGTYYGGSLVDEGWFSSIDPVGNSYLSGSTRSLNNIATAGAYQTTFGGLGTGQFQGDCFLVKFSPAGTRLWGTYYGGSGSDFSNMTALDLVGNIFMVGASTSTNVGVMSTPGCHQLLNNGGAPHGDCFLVKFDANGIRQWSTFYGGIATEWAIGCCVDATGYVYMSGGTFSSGGTNIATPGSHQPTYSGSSCDAFLVKFDPAGVRQWGTYYGGNNYDNGHYCNVDNSGNVYLCGEARSTNTITIATPGCHQSVMNGGGWGDGFVAKFNSTGVRQWGTYYGGPANDVFYNGVCDAMGNIYMGGYSATTTGTTIATPGSHQPNFGGGASDNFIVKFNASGTRQWASYYGGSGIEDYGYTGIDPNGDVYLGGQTSTPNGTAIATPCTYQDINGGGGCDAFIAKFTQSGTRVWGTYYGGTGTDYWGTSNFDATGNIYLAGSTTTSSGTVIASPSGHQPVYGGGTSDAYLVKFSPCTPLLPPNNTAPPLMTICAGNSTILSSSLTCGIKWYNDSIAGTLLGSGSNLNTPPLSTTTTFYIEDPSCGISGPRTAVEVTVMPLPVINITTNDPLICIGQSATLIASGATTYTWAPSVSLSTTLDFSVVATPVVNSIYTVTGSNGSCSGTNSIPINLVPKPNPIISALDNKVCIGSTLTLNASGAQTYSWLPSNLVSNPNGSVTAANPPTATTFTLVGVNTIGMVSCVENTIFSVNVLPYAKPLISGNVTICEGDEAVLTVSGGNTFNWTPNSGISNPNDFGIVVSPTTSSVYSVNVSNNGYCGTTATVMVHVNPKPTVYAGRDTTFNLKEPMIITAVGDGTLKWILGDDISCADCPSTQIFPIKNSCYVIEAINSFGCRAIDEVCIDVSRENVLYIPNTFTPNGDGLNDEFYVSGFGFSDITLEIFDRWGVQLFSSNEVTQGWNGKYKGKECQIATYIYKLSYSKYGGKLTTKTGHVNLVR